MTDQKDPRTNPTDEQLEIHPDDVESTPDPETDRATRHARESERGLPAESDERVDRSPAAGDNVEKEENE